MKCLQTWFHCSTFQPHNDDPLQGMVHRCTGSGAVACKVCGQAYKTSYARPGADEDASPIPLLVQVSL